MIRTSTITLRIEDDDAIWEKVIDYHEFISMVSPYASLLKMHNEGQRLIDSFSPGWVCNTKDKS